MKCNVGATYAREENVNGNAFQILTMSVTRSDLQIVESAEKEKCPNVGLL